MYSKIQFYDLEVMCHVARCRCEERNGLWLAEAEEWARFRLSCNQRQVGSSELTQSTKLKG